MRRYVAALAVTWVGLCVGTGPLAIAGHGGAAGAKKKPIAATHKVPPALQQKPAALPQDAREIDISVMREGTLVRFRLEGAHLVAYAGPLGADVRADRQLKEAERAQVVALSRSAMADADTRFGCNDKRETFISVAIDRKLSYTSLCGGVPPFPGYGAHWQALLDYLRNFLEPAEAGTPQK